MSGNNYQPGQADLRPWGRWEVLGVGNAYAVKRIDVLPGARLSLQYHNHRAEHWIVVAGSGIVTIGEHKKRVATGDHLFIPRKTKHRIANNSDVTLVFIEVQTGERLEEEDIVRVQDDYDRTTPQATGHPSGNDKKV